MKKISKVLLSSGMAACMMAGLFASPTATSTNNLFATDADKYMDVLDFSDVEFDKLFTDVNVSYGSDVGAGAGVAFNAFGLYFGASYMGFGLDGSSTKNTTVTTVQKEGTNTAAGTVDVTDKTTTVKKTSDIGSCWQMASILTGIGNIGIKATVQQWGEKKTNNDNGDVTKEEVNEIDAPIALTKTRNSTDTTRYLPVVEVGLPIELGDDVLNLKAGVGVDIQNNKTYNTTETYKWYNNEKGDLISTTYTDNNSGSLSINPSVSASIFNASIAYDGEFGLYGKSVKDAAGNKIKTKGYTNTKSNSTTVSDAGEKTTTDSTNVSYNPLKSHNKQVVTLGYSNSKELNEKLTVAFGTSAKVVMNFDKNGTSATANSSTKTVTKKDYSNAVANSVPAVYLKERTTLIETTDNKVVSTTDISVIPVVKVAAQYALKPAVKLNFGYAVTGKGTNGVLFNSNVVKTTYKAANPKTVTTKKEIYSDDKVIETKTVDYVTEDTRNESKNVTNTWSQISSTFSTGITFQMTENMTLDSTMNFGKTGLDSFDEIFKNLTIGATVKF